MTLDRLWLFIMWFAAGVLVAAKIKQMFRGDK